MSNNTPIPKKVLLIDDDRELSSLISQYLVKEGFSVTVEHHGSSGMQQALFGNHDIVVLDVMMPGMSGIDVLMGIRSQSQVPVLMLTAKGDNADRIEGLELGADDYVPKPCTSRELVARIRAILRRTEGAIVADKWQDVYVSDELMIYLGQRRAEWAGHHLDLTATEFNLLQILVQNAGQVVSRDVLSEKALGRPLAKYDRSIDVHLTNIRKKLGGFAGARNLIKTVHRQGYQLLVG